MLFKKKDISKIDNNKIAEDIEKILDENQIKNKPILKLFTFIMLFSFYIYICVILEGFASRILVMVFGIIFLIILFQSFVIPSFYKKKELKLKI